MNFQEGHQTRTPPNKDMKKCPDCGYEIPKDYRKCNVCGKYIVETTTDTNLFMKYRRQ